MYRLQSTTRVFSHANCTIVQQMTAWRLMFRSVTILDMDEAAKCFQLGWVIRPDLEQ